jgi:hypothetical protein
MTYGLKEAVPGADTAVLIKIAARILATVMNHMDAKGQFLDQSIQPLVNLMTLMAENNVFDVSTQLGIVDQIEFVANGLKIVRLLTSHTAYTGKIQAEFPDFISVVGGLLSAYFENGVIQSEGRAILQNYIKVNKGANSAQINYSSNYLQK